MNTNTSDIFMQTKVFGYLALATVLILSIPLIAKQFTSEVNWDMTDFIVMGTLIFGTGSLFIVASRLLKTTKMRITAGIMLGLIFLYIWAELAVGIFTNWGS